MLLFPGKPDPATDSLSPEVRKILGLDPQANEFPVVYGAIPKDDKEIAILTRSISMSYWIYLRTSKFLLSM